MLTILVIIPYPELYDKAEAVLRENAGPDIRYQITHLYGTKVDEMDVGDADIILARGLTQKTIKRKFPHLTVLEMSVGTYDVVQAIYACKKRFGAGKIAVVGSDVVLHDMEAIREMLGVELRFFSVAYEEEIRKVLDVIGREGFDAIAGGLTACTIAREYGFNNSLIRTGEETLGTAIKDAMNTAAVMLQERAKAEISRSILHNSQDAILYFDSAGRLSLYNQRACDLMHFPTGPHITGKTVGELFNDRDIIQNVLRLKEARGLLKTVNQNSLLFNFSPVNVDGRTIGVVCTFQPVQEIQAVETKIRKELSRKGLVAKYGFGDIVHAGNAMQETIATAEKYADADANVLLIGETGTGKELFAQSIHSSSRRRAGPFVAVNCAAFTESLLESELFGYAEGSFTGAAKGGKIGLFELAHGGSIFLDEIGEIPLTLQATLLRALQEREIRRIGDDKVVPVNVRVIAATNIDLAKKVKEGGFRIDLLYRLDVLSLRIPPLRRRREDILGIFRYYIKRYCLEYDKPELKLTLGAMAVLEGHDWPGNARELRNVCERLVVLAAGPEITRESVLKTLAIETACGAMERGGKEERFSGRDAGELAALVKSMKMNQAEIASVLGISRTTLWRRMKGEGRGGERGEAGGKSET